MKPAPGIDEVLYRSRHDIATEHLRTVESRFSSRTSSGRGQCSVGLVVKMSFPRVYRLSVYEPFSQSLRISSMG